MCLHRSGETRLFLKRGHVVWAPRAKQYSAYRTARLQSQTWSHANPVTNPADTRRFCIYQDCFWVDFSQYTIQNS